MTKKTINIRIEGIYPDLPQSLDNIISMLQEYKKTYGDKFSNLEIQSQDDYGYSYQYYLYGERLETDQEYSTRLKKEEEQQKRQEIWDRKQFEALKKKFKEK